MGFTIRSPIARICNKHPRADSGFQAANPRYPHKNYFKYPSNWDDAKREEFKKIGSKIVDTQVYKFDSYSEASIYKQK